MLDATVIAFYKARAGKRGCQTLIHQALVSATQANDLHPA